MAKGKYKRKTQQSGAEEEQGQPHPTFVEAERNDKLNERDERQAGKRTGDPKEIRWYFRFSSWIKQPYIHSMAIAGFTAALVVANIYQGWITHGQLAAMEKAQRPFVLTNITLASDWHKDTEHDMEVTVLMQNASAFPAVNVVNSIPKVYMGPDPRTVIDKCDFAYRSGAKPTYLAPANAGSGAVDAMQTVHTDYIYDKSRIDNGIDTVVVYGGIRYSGISGGDFETTYCYMYLPRGDFRFGTCGGCEGMK